MLLENSNGSHYIRFTVPKVFHPPQGARTRPLKQAGNRGLTSKTPSCITNHSGRCKTPKNHTFHNDVLLESMNGSHFLRFPAFSDLDTRRQKKAGKGIL
jgi:hypothetical protein